MLRHLAIPATTAALLCGLLVSCGGGAGGGTSAAVDSASTGGAGGTAPGTTSGTIGTPNTGASGSGGGGTTGTAAGTTTTQSAARLLAAKLNKPARLLVGLGTGAELASIQAQGLKPDVYDRYLVGVGSGSWPDWNSPSGAYVDIVAANADKMGAVPMFTLYQMASNGDGNLGGLKDPQFMAKYWANARLLFQRLAVYNKPAMVNLEPDFWGYAQQQAPNGDPRQLPAQVSIDADCAGQPDNVTGIAGCLVQMARKYAPKALVGFPTSDWGAPQVASVANFMKQLGAQKGDFTALNTLDRDAGCFEAKGPGCTRGGSGWYWDESNAAHPNFADHLAAAKTYSTTLGLPLVWWQTPMGVPSATPGGTPGHYRDNRMHYFLTHPAELTAVGGLAVIFSAGADGQTTIDTDGGQYKSLSESYLAHPAALP